MIGSLRGTLLDRGADEVTVEVGGVGYRVTVSPTTAVVARRRRRRGLLLGAPPPARGRRHPLRLRHQGRAGVLRGAARRPRRRPGAGAGDPVDPHAGRARPDPRRGRPRRAVPGARASARRRPPGCSSTSSRASRSPTSGTPVLPGGRGRRRRSPTALADVRDALAELGYSEPEIREVMADLPARRRRRRPAARRAPAAGRRAAVGTHRCARSCCDPRSWATRSRSPPRPACGPARSRSSSASPSSRATSRSSSRRRAGGARRSTTCCSPARPGSARRASPGSSPRRWASTIHVTSGPAIERAGDLAAMLSQLGEGDVLFIDEIHRLPRVVEEVLYPAMEDFQIDIVLGQGPGGAVDPARPPAVHPRRRHHPHRLDHRSAPRPLRPRRPPRLLRAEDLVDIVTRAAGILGVQVDADGAWEIARRARGTPRIANRLLRRVRDFAEVKGDGAVDLPTASDGPRHLRRRRARPRQGRPRHPLGDLRALRRRPGRPVHARHQRGRADRDGRGRLRALPHPGRPAHAHAPRAGGHRRRLRPPRPRRRRAGAPGEDPLPGLPRAEPSAAAAHTGGRHGHGRPRLRPAGGAIAQTPVEPRDAARLLVDAGPGPPPRAPARPRPAVAGPARATSWSSTPRGCCPPGCGSPSPPAGRWRSSCSSRRDGEPTAGRRWCARAARCRPGTELAARRRLAVVRSARTSARVAAASSVAAGRRHASCSTCSSATVRSRSRRTSPPRWPIPSATRPPTPSSRARSPRRPPACTSPRRCSTRCAPPACPVVPVELVVGLGTFRPIAVDTVEEHQMHAERYRVPDADDGGVRARPTGSWRSAPRACAPSSRPRPPASSRAAPSCSSTVTGRSRVVGALMTNFHQPRSSLLALVDAFVGPRWRALYDEALRARATGSSASATPCSSRASADDPVDGGHRHRRSGPCRHDPHGARRDHHAVLHAGGHEGRGAAPVVG